MIYSLIHISFSCISNCKRGWRGITTTEKDKTAGLTEVEGLHTHIKRILATEAKRQSKYNILDTPFECNAQKGYRKWYLKKKKSSFKKDDARGYRS